MLDVDVALASDNGCVAIGRWSNGVVQGTTYTVPYSILLDGILLRRCLLGHSGRFLASWAVLALV